MYWNPSGFRESYPSHRSSWITAGNPLPVSFKTSSLLPWGCFPRPVLSPVGRMIMSPLLASLLPLSPISLLRASVIKCFKGLTGVCPFHGLLAFFYCPVSPSKAVPEAYRKISGLSPAVLQPLWVVPPSFHAFPYHDSLTWVLISSASLTSFMITSYVAGNVPPSPPAPPTPLLPTHTLQFNLFAIATHRPHALFLSLALFLGFYIVCSLQPLILLMFSFVSISLFYMDTIKALISYYF